MIQKIIFNENVKIERNIACIGYFDGAHKGHQQLINKTVELANSKGLTPVLITFDPDPYEVINKEKNKQITNLKERIKLFEMFGIKKVVIVPFDDSLMKMSTLEFKENILDHLNIDVLVCGFDYSYGYKGKGNYKTLKKDGVNIELVKEYTFYGKKVSSTRIRNEIDKGNYKLVNRLLGYEYKR